MKKTMMLVLLALPAFGQVTSTDTEGKGGMDVFSSFSYYPAPDYNTAATDALLLFGLTGRLDIMAGPALSFGGQKRQWAVEAGLQYKLLERGSWKILTLDLATLPFNNRTAGDPTLFASVTVNKEISIRKKKFTVYGGYGPTIALGGKTSKLFSYKDSIHNFPLGIMVPVGEKLQWFAEYGIKRPDYFSVGLSYNIKKSR